MTSNNHWSARLNLRRCTLMVLVAMLPATLGAEGIDPRKVSVLYVGDPYPGVTPYLDMREDAFIEVDPIQAYHHGGSQVPLADIYKYMRIYMPRTYERCVAKYDVILLSDAYRRAFQPVHLMWFRDGVQEEGQGLVMVAGLDSYGASSSRPDASWQGSMVEEVLPVAVPDSAVHHNWIQPYVNPAGARILIEDYGNEFMSSLPFEPAPRYTWAFNGQIVHEKQGSQVLARWNLPGFNNPPCYSTWTAGKGRTFAMLHDWTESTDFSRWEYYPDFAMNLMLYVAQRQLPTDYVVVHEYRSNVRRVSIGKSMILSLVYFVESFGGNPARIDAEIAVLDSMKEQAKIHYLDADFVVALAASQATLGKLVEIEKLSIKVKNEALLWVYVVEWLSVTGVSLISGFAVWSLMVRRRLYHEVRATKLSKLSDDRLGT